MMTTASYPTATFQASPTSNSYQQQPNATDYGYGNGNYNYNYYPTTTATTTTNTNTNVSVGYGGSAQQSTYNNNNPYQQMPQLGYNHPNPPPPHAYGTVTNEAMPADGDTPNSEQKTKRRWSLYGRSRNGSMDGGAEAPINAPGATNHQDVVENDSSNNNSKKERRWSLRGRSRNGSMDGSETGSQSKSIRSAPPNQQLVVYNVPPSETFGQKQSEPNPGFWPKEIHPDRQAMKNDRKAKMAGAATTGAIIGGVLTGPAWPVGAMAGAAIASYAGKVTARAGERRQQRKWEQKNFNAYLAKGKAGVQSESVAFA